MASSPRTGRTSPALFALVICAVLILGVIAMVVLGFDPVRVGRGVLSSFFPPPATATMTAIRMTSPSRGQAKLRKARRRSGSITHPDWTLIRLG